MFPVHLGEVEVTAHFKDYYKYFLRIEISLRGIPKIKIGVVRIANMAGVK